VWVAAFEGVFIRLDAYGHKLQKSRAGEPERPTPFCLSAATSYEELRQRKSSSQIDEIDAEIAVAGYP
jgi:hypothetical protein